MTKRQNNRTSYRVNSIYHYIVTLERLANTAYGNPRYEATIINIDNEDIYLCSYVYRFTGHYMDEISEAKWIVKHHESEVLK